MHERPNENRRDRAIRLASSCCAMLELDPPKDLDDARARLRILQRGFEAARRRSDGCREPTPEEQRDMLRMLENRALAVGEQVLIAKRGVDNAWKRRRACLSKPCFVPPGTSEYDKAKLAAEQAEAEFGKAIDTMEELWSDIDQMKKETNTEPTRKMQEKGE